MTQPEVVRTRGEESREAILVAARQLFGQRGFRGTSLASIAEAAGLSQPGLLHHFPSKTDLLLAVLASRDASDGQMSSRLSGDIVDGLRTLVAHNQAQPEVVRLFSTLLGESLAVDHPGHDYFVTRYKDIRARFVRHLTEAQVQGALSPGISVPALANVLIAVLDGLQFQWLLDDSVDMKAGYGLLAGLITPDR
jgi:AcrR family transcriptional regulator